MNEPNKNPRTAVEAIAMSANSYAVTTLLAEDPSRVWNEFKRLREKGLVTVTLKGTDDEFDVKGDVCGRAFNVRVRREDPPPERLAPVLLEHLKQAERDRAYLLAKLADIDGDQRDVRAAADTIERDLDDRRLDEIRARAVLAAGGPVGTPTQEPRE